MKAKGRSRKSQRCSVGVELGDPALPVAGTGSLGAVRKSKTSRWRAGVLISAHVLILAHIAHFMVAGRTLSPVEPSESMYTLELGYLNAGFVFFAAAILSTAIFGRFFCGWGCHIVALQDLCGWIMKKVGIRPHPFRSRLLLYGPLLLALYMFVWPALKRVVFPATVPDFPGFTNHLMTAEFWKTFPGPVFAVLTFLVCGFLAVYFLGAKGFCTYGCPYGAFFGIADKFSPGRIRVTDACEQCGHCTATCTSNVRVHAEVKQYGMVVDPGCMKCMDCVSVCPMGALYFGFGRPQVMAATPDPAHRPRRHDLSGIEEIALAAICLGATLAFRGLYDGPPFLMALGMGAITSFVALKLWRLSRDPGVRVQNLRLRSGGRLQRSGWIFAVVATLWLAFTAHSAFVQWHRNWGRYHLNRTEVQRSEIPGGEFLNKRYSDTHYRSLDRAHRHFSLAERWGLADVGEVKLGLAWTELILDRPAVAEQRIREAVALEPDNPAQYRGLSEFLVWQQRLPEALDAKLEEMRLGTPTAAEHFEVAGLLIANERLEEAAEHYAACVKLAPGSAEARYNLGGVLRRLGRPAEAVEHLAAALDLVPGDADTHVELALAHEALGETDRAIELLRRAVDLNPSSAESRRHLVPLIEQLERGRRGAPGD